MKEILISGYYGFQNNGDDALLLSIINDLKKTNADAPLVVLSRAPEETERIYGVKSINRFNIPLILYHMTKADMLISGGGSLIQDATSTKSLWYYLLVIELALMCGLKIMLYANGIGPLTHPSSRRLSAKILNKTNLITLRDDSALKVLEDIGVTKPKTVLTADPVFNLEISDNGGELLKRLGIKKPCIGISVRPWKTLPPDFADIMAEFSDYAYERYGLEPLLIPMQPKKDLAISEQIAARAKHKPAVFKDKCEVSDMLSLVRETDVCVCMRLHMLIYAAAGSVPPIGLVYDPKISGFMNYMHHNMHIAVEKVSVDALKNMLDKTMSDYDAIKDDLTRNAAELHDKAALNVQFANALYKKGVSDIG